MEDGLLIEQVSSFPQLYVKSDPRFENIRMKENAWKTIGIILEETPEACEHRWKILRNKYTALKRERHPSGSGASEVTTWPYFDSMRFLDPYLLTRKSFSNIRKTPEAKEWDSMSSILQEDPSAEKENSPEGYIEDEETSTSAPSSSQLPPKNKLKSIPRHETEASTSAPSSAQLPPKRKLTSIPRHTLPAKIQKSDNLADKMTGCFETFQKVLESNSSTQPTDQEHFVRSVVNDMKVFSHKENILIKREIYNVLARHVESLHSDDSD